MIQEYMEWYLINGYVKDHKKRDTLGILLEKIKNMQIISHSNQKSKSILARFNNFQSFDSNNLTISHIDNLSLQLRKNFLKIRKSKYIDWIEYTRIMTKIYNLDWMY